MSHNENRKALLIGVNKYDNLPPDGNLNNCVRDAEKMEIALRRHENKEDNFFTILCKNPKHETIRENVEKVLSRNTKHALIYFSGHGLRDAKSNREYLVGKDYSTSNPGVCADWLMDTLNQSEVQEITLILDCCYAASMGLHLINNKVSNCLREGITILAATQSEDVASEGRSGQNSVFTDIILQGLNGAAIDVFGNVTAAGLYHLADSLLTPLEQRPVFKSVVTQMTPLRKCKSDLTPVELRQLSSPQFFRSKDRELQLYPSDITTDKNKIATRKKYELLLKFYRYGFLKCQNQLSVYEAALQSKTCELSPYGKFFWGIINKK